MSNFTIPVHLYMSAPVRSIRADETLQAAYEQLQSHHISSLAVVDDQDRLAGVLSRTDLLRVGRYQAGARKDADLLTLPVNRVSAIMTRDVITVGPEDTVEAACAHIVQRRVHRVFVKDGDKLAGVLSTRDVMRAIADKRMNKPIEEFMSTPLFTVRASEPISLATERLERAHVTGLVVVEDDWPVGVYTQIEALRARELPRDTPVEEAMNAAMVCMGTDTRMFRAAQQALAMHVRRVIACSKRDMVGILTGIDFARAAMS